MMVTINAMKRILGAACLALALAGLVPVMRAQSASAPSPVREQLLMDEGWRFALGHATDASRDFDPAPLSDSFNYFSKAGRASGAASAKFDDSGWRVVDLPHDWAVELPFDARGSHSHGYKALGKVFPENSVGWYRRKFFIPKEDLGRHIEVEFGGVFRDSQVWVNGFYLGRHSSGYTSFAYDLTDYLDYGGENVIAVRTDASLEEGWFYEGAGIYRHVWLTKTGALHVAHWGTYITTDVAGDASAATVNVTVTAKNDGAAPATFKFVQTVTSADGKTVAEFSTDNCTLTPGASHEFAASCKVSSPRLWSPETPNLYTLETTLLADSKVTDRYETPFGIRTIKWTADNGFFLNGKHVEIKGTNNHQDHAGVGAAMPDSLVYERIRILKEMGCNAYRMSHNPPAPEVLDACDRLGMLVLDENRETGTNEQQLGGLRDMILRDRNHPSVVLWSVGNEEWAIEGGEKGARVTRTMQNYVRQLDSTRPSTVAISGGWGHGSSTTTEVMGFNYFNHGDVDAYHAQFPNVPTVGTEESACYATRGVYFEDRAKCRLTAYDTNADRWFTQARDSIAFYMNRPWTAGAFRWTAFDYRGEPTPFAWPANASQFGAMDTCGFPKDVYYLYQAWWGDKPLLHVFPHWNWKGREGQPIEVWAYGNCEEVELFLNGKSLGRQPMTKYGNCAWQVPYAPGKLVAKGYVGGKETLSDTVETTGPAATLKLSARRTALAADGDDVALVTVEVTDAEGRRVPDAMNAVSFDISGPGRIIGVGNGDPASLEADKCADGQWRRSLFNGLAQVIVQTRRGETGTITLFARSNQVKNASLELEAGKTLPRPTVPVPAVSESALHAPVPALVEADVPAKPVENQKK
jgi:beta-galactosidase